MKSISMSIKDVTKFVSGRMLAITLAGMLALPVAAYSQEQEENAGGNAADVEAVTPSSSSSGPWQNSAGSTIGSGANSNAASTPRVDPRLGPGGGTLGRGPVTTAGGPGGNPDVPFDDTMNLAFLVAGLAFAFVVVKKQLALKTVPVKNK